MRKLVIAVPVFFGLVGLFAFARYETLAPCGMLRTQAKRHLFAELGTEQLTDGFRALGMALGVAMVDKMLEAYTASLTPMECLRALVRLESDDSVPRALSDQFSARREDVASDVFDSPAPPPNLPERPKWTVSQRTNPIDDSSTVTLVNTAKEGRSRFGDTVDLVIRCQSNRTELYINWHDYLGSSAIRVLTRIGTAEATEQRWSLSTDNRATFYPTASPIPFIKQLIEADTLVAQTTPYNESPITAVWDLADLETAIQPLRSTCSW